MKNEKAPQSADRLAYSRQHLKAMLGWIRPGVVAKTALEFIEKPGDSAAPCYMSIFTPHRFDANESIVFEAMSQFLDDFHVPEELLEFCRKVYPSCFNEAAINKLRPLKFSGEIVRENKSADYPDHLRKAVERGEAKFIAGLEAPCIEMRILQAPLQALVDQVASLSGYWQDLATKHNPLAFHHDHGMETRLLASLDADVAQRAGFASVGPGGMKTPILRLHSYFGGESFVLCKSVTENARASFDLLYTLRSRK